MAYSLLLLLCWTQICMGFEYETEDGWYAAAPSTRVELIDITSLVMHASDIATDHEGHSTPGMQCRDGLRGMSDWFADTPTCDTFMSEYKCVQCESRSKRCCSLDLACAPCMEHLDIHIDKPRLVCDPYNGITIRAIDPSSCVLQFEISQDRNVLGMEIGIVVWLLLYNLVVALMVNSLYKSWALKCREIGIGLLCSVSIVLVFIVYVHLHIWYVYTPFYVAYAALCLVPIIRMFFYRKRGKNKKEIV